ncbi:hypothetical protein CFC21_066479 [Triticum aestivum]|uniref:Large ribosomal subunit protein uL2 C-terminal domain-containing protein n=2 Tax=Triticum aestivum TaxID=4565 RepID=A0A3B6KI38_WHEAT|nr:hypothetical protein CFC21_066479 [Triticum aestivum]
MYTGQSVHCCRRAVVGIGNVFPLASLPEGAIAWDVEQHVGDRGALARASGDYAIVVSHNSDNGEEGGAERLAAGRWWGRWPAAGGWKSRCSRREFTSSGCCRAAGDARRAARRTTEARRPGSPPPRPAMTTPWAPSSYRAWRTKGGADPRRPVLCPVPDVDGLREPPVLPVVTRPYSA